MSYPKCHYISASVGDQQLGGIWQISGERDVPYSELAILGAKVLGVDLNLIKPWTISDAGLDIEANPANTTMDNERLRQDLGLVPPSITWTIQHLFYEHR